MQVPIHLPDLGADNIVLSVWFADIGDDVFEGDRLVEVLAGSATFDVSAPATGTLVEQVALEYDALHTGQILGLLEVNE